MNHLMHEHRGGGSKFVELLKGDDNCYRVRYCVTGKIISERYSFTVEGLCSATIHYQSVVNLIKGSI